VKEELGGNWKEDELGLDEGVYDRIKGGALPRLRSQVRCVWDPASLAMTEISERAANSCKKDERILSLDWSLETTETTSWTWGFLHKHVVQKDPA
jgi:hypothetical protein